MPPRCPVTTSAMRTARQLLTQQRHSASAVAARRARRQRAADAKLMKILGKGGVLLGTWIEHEAGSGRGEEPARCLNVTCRQRRSHASRREARCLALSWQSHEDALRRLLGQRVVTSARHHHHTDLTKSIP